MFQRLAIFLTIGFCICVNENSWASNTSLTNGVKDFFKTPQSIFRSGQSTITELSQKRIQSKSISVSLIEIGKYHEWIPTDRLYSLKDFTYSSTITPMSAFSKNNAIIYKKIQNKWTAYRRFKRGISFTVEQMIGAWACGNFENDYICVGNQELILAVDFADILITKKNEKFHFKERKEDQLFTIEGTTLAWKDLKSWQANSETAFIKPHPTLPIKGSLTAFEKVQVKDHKIQHWVESVLTDHGSVWWIMNSFIPENSPLIISTEDLKARGVFDWDTNKKSLSLASAQGVFLSDEKDSWKFLPQFGENNYPVAVAIDKTLFIGDQYSTDDGETFEPFIRWDTLSEIIQNILQKTPKWIKLTKLQLPSKKSNQIQFEIDTGFRSMTFRTQLATKNIQYLK